MAKTKILNLAKDFLILLCSVAITRVFTAEVLHKSGFFIEMIIFVAANAILVGIYEFIKFICNRFKGDTTIPDYKVQAHNILFIALVVIFGAVLSNIFS